MHIILHYARMYQLEYFRYFSCNWMYLQQQHKATRHLFSLLYPFFKFTFINPSKFKPKQNKTKRTFLAPRFTVLSIKNRRETCEDKCAINTITYVDT